MRQAATQSPNPSDDALTSRIESDIIGVLLALIGAAALWWAGTWWWLDARAEAAPAPRPPTLETTLPPAPPRFERHRDVALTLSSARVHTPDAGGEVAAASAPTRVVYGVESGHGSESWSRSDAPARQDFEPRYWLDGGALAAPPVAVEAARAFH